MADLRPTLKQFLEAESGEPHAQLIECFASAARDVSQILAIAPITGNLGTVEGAPKNATGDVQKKIDLITNDLFVKRLSSLHLLHRIVSEEMAHPLVVGDRGEAPLLLAIDPIDGSSNIDVNGVVATIFGIYRDIRDPLPMGRDLVAAGYVLYGPSTMLVMTTGHGVNGFTLDRASGRFLLSHPNIRCRERGNYLCANVAHFSKWPDSVQWYLDELIKRSQIELTPLSFRYSGAMATDSHLILMNGGIYIYPPDAHHWTGKIRLLYESVPMAYVFDQAGGASSNCVQSLLDVQALEPHQQDHMALGSRHNVQDYVSAVLSSQSRQSA